ncbi:MAG: hypothetical protein ABSF77_00155 [Spirochaetia bacterium]|jgi:hypothetical protein
MDDADENHGSRPVRRDVHDPPISALSPANPYSPASTVCWHNVEAGDPGAPPNATGGERYTVREISGHTWIELAQPVAVDFVPAGQKTDIVKPAPGHLAIKTIKKPQILRFTGSIYQLTDNKGDSYVMHATETGTPSLNVILPAGWTLRKVDLAEPLIIAPSQGGYYNIVGDCLGQGYHQYIFADAIYPARNTTP